MMDIYQDELKELIQDLKAHDTEVGDELIEDIKLLISGQETTDVVVALALVLQIFVDEYGYKE